MNKVYITGIGIISPLGMNAEEHITALKNCLSGIKNTSDDSQFFLDQYGKAVDFNPKDYIEDRKALKIMSRQTVLGSAASNIAMKEAHLTKDKIEKEANDNSIIFGAGIWNGGIITMIDAIKASLSEKHEVDYEILGNKGYRNLPPLWILPRLPNTTAGQISIQNQIKGLNYSVVNGPNSGTIAIGEAFINVNTGRCKRVFTGAAEGVANADLFHHFKNKGIVTENVKDAIPFGEESKSSFCGEGASVIVLEDKGAIDRLAQIQGEIIAYSNFYVPGFSSSNAESISFIYQACMTETIKNGGIHPGQVGFIQANASGNPVIDKAEAMAILHVFKGITPVTSIHSLTGNLFAASGPISLACALFQMNNSFIASLKSKNNLFFEDKINYVRNGAITANTKHVLVNSFDHTGSACCILIRKFN